MRMRVLLRSVILESCSGISSKNTSRAPFEEGLVAARVQCALFQRPTLPLKIRDCREMVTRLQLGWAIRRIPLLKPFRKFRGIFPRIPGGDHAHSREHVERKHSVVHSDTRGWKSRYIDALRWHTRRYIRGIQVILSSSHVISKWRLVMRSNSSWSVVRGLTGVGSNWHFCRWFAGLKNKRGTLSLRKVQDIFKTYLNLKKTSHFALKPINCQTFWFPSISRKMRDLHGAVEWYTPLTYYFSNRLCRASKIGLECLSLISWLSALNVDRNRFL